VEQGGDKLGMRTLRVTWANSSTQGGGGGGRGGGGGAARTPPRATGPMSVEDVSAQTGDANRTVYVAGLGTDGEVTIDEDGAAILDWRRGEIVPGWPKLRDLAQHFD
jgi:hypothetical protein